MRQDLAALVRWLGAIFTNQNGVSTFFVWYFLTLVLEGVALLVAFKVIAKLNLDTTLLATAISTPLLVAAAALVPSKRAPDSGD
jgi:hypothetical protein